MRVALVEAKLVGRVKRETVLKLSGVEERALAQLAQAAREYSIARRVRDDFIGVCVDLGLPIRLVGKHARLSGAQVSRMNGARRVRV